MADHDGSDARERRDRWIAGVVVLVALLLAATGTPRLIEDGDAAYRLPEAHAMHRLNERFVDGTGGDDVVGVLVVSEESLVSPAGLEGVSAVRDALATAGAITGVRDFTTLSLLTVRDETITGETPLDPAPTTDEGWAAARSRLMKDPFTAGLLSEDARVALVVGWVRRDDADARFVDRVARDLADAGFRATDAGGALRAIVDQARLDVMMGDRPGPPHAAVAAALGEARGGDGPAAAHLAEAARIAEADAADPEAAARAAVDHAILAAAGPGRRLLPVGAPFVERAVSERYAEHLALAFLGLFAALPVLVAGRRESWKVGGKALAAAAVALGGAVGVLGWFGVPLHPISAGLILGASVLTALGLLGAGSPRQPRLELLLLLLLPWCSRDLHGVTGLGLSAALAIAWATVWTAGRTVRVVSAGIDPELLGLTRRPSPAAMGAAGLLVAVGVGAAASAPLGIRPSHWLSDQDPAGVAVLTMDAHLGGGTPLHVVSAAGPGAMADPELLADLRAAEEALADHPAVESVVGWTHFISALHSAVAGDTDGALPDRADLVQQYLLMFDRPEDTRPLVAPDKSVGTGFIRVRPGEDGRLAELAETLPAGTGGPAVAGRAAALVLGGLFVTRSLALLLGLGVVVALGALLWVPVAGAARPASFDERLSSVLTAVHVAIPSGCVAVGAAALAGKSLGPEALLAGAIVAGTSLAVTRCDERDRLQAFVLVGLGLGVLLLGPVAPLRGLGVGAAVGAVAALGLGRTAA